MSDAFKTLDDYTVFPCPGLRMTELEWRLRYVEPHDLTRNDVVLAASIVSAYRYLIMTTGDRRSKVCSQLKREVTKKPTRPASGGGGG